METTQTHQHLLSELYTRLADMLPVEGRDYLVETSVRDKKFAVKIAGLTPLGKLWAAYCTEVLKRPAKDTQTPKRIHLL